MFQPHPHTATLPQSEGGTYLDNSRHSILSSAAVVTRSELKEPAPTFTKSASALDPCGKLCLVIISHCFLLPFVNGPAFACARVGVDVRAILVGHPDAGRA